MKNKLKNQKAPFLVIFGASLFLILPQLLNHTLILGGDSLFHLNRIYDVYMQFKTGNFSYFQTNYGFLQSGRIINALYGPGFVYILGALLAIVHSWIKFQLITSFLTFFISGYTMFLLSREMGSTKKVSILTAILFMNSFWITGWSLDQAFMTWGTMLVPLVVIIGLKMIKNNADGLHIIPFALIVSLLVQVHVLSTLMSLIVLGIFFIVGMVKTTKKGQLLLKCIFAALLTLILTFNVWGSMLDVFTSNKLYAPFSELTMSNFTTSFSTSNYDFTHIGLVLSVIFALQIGLLISRNATLSLPNKIVTVLGAIFLILASNFIPWTKLGTSFTQLQSFLQFPYRFIGLATILLLAGFGATISSVQSKTIREYAEILLVVSSVFLLVQSYTELQKSSESWNTSEPIMTKRYNDFIGGYSDQQIKNMFASPDLGKGLKAIMNQSSDYLPNHYAGNSDAYNAPSTHANRNVGDSEAYAAYGKYINRNQAKFTKKVIGDKLVISWNAKKKSTKVHLPIVIYSESVVTLNNRDLDKNQMELSAIGTPTVTSSRVGKNTLTLAYHSTFITAKSIMIVVVAWVISILSLVIIKIRNEHK
ncbi:MFS transporter [Dellaglioa algida]|uniref:MFS transporter n=1 Tax=Dellaglioa algida TaxID=105612 RepID=UPI0024C4CB05|nr:MFS transporter [Dellaglioa algida]MDK1724777.1 MFS transporter [Dellaglioa algida]MDK1738683.1 MFS transporter [Dellaglioa algida]